MRSQVLGLINDKERLAEAAPPDIGQRSDQQLLVLQESLDMLVLPAARTVQCLDDIEIVHQRLEERAHLVLLVARQKTDVLITENHGRTRKDYLVEFLLTFQG